MPANIFCIGDRFPGASNVVKQSLIKVNFKTEACSRVRSMLRRLKLKFSEAVWERDCWAHFGLKDSDINIMLMGTLNEARASKFRTLWKNHGRKLMVIAEGGLEGLSDATMDAMFSAAVKELSSTKLGYSK